MRYKVLARDPGGEAVIEGVLMGEDARVVRDDLFRRVAVKRFGRNVPHEFLIQRGFTFDVRPVRMPAQEAVA